MPKKGKGKKAGKGNKAEEMRLAQLAMLETEAEDFQKHENERRQREIQDERISLLREEQLRQIREKERRIEELNSKVSQVFSTLSDDRLSYAGQIESLSVLRDSLMNEVSLLRAENEERHYIFSRERENYIKQVEQLRYDVAASTAAFEEEKAELRQKNHTLTLELEEASREKEEIQDEKDDSERQFTLKIRALERELERALTINTALQQAVENREADDKKNITMMQMLNAQLDETRRHFEQRLEDEQLLTTRVKEELLQAESKCAHLQEELDIVKAEWSDAKHAASVELREYQRQLEQVKFDAEYLNKELEATRRKSEESVQMAEVAREEAQNEAKNCIVDMEGLQKKVEDLEALLYRKEREHFDKVTFLNAQISNNRTVISKFQEKMNEERQAHTAQTERRELDLQQTLGELKQLNEAEKATSVVRQENEKRLLSDISVLKTTVFQLQSAMDEKEKANDSILAAKNDEIQRLHDLLDSHFIPHRHDVEQQQSVAATDEAFVIKAKMEELQRELALREQASLESEAWLKSRLANQSQVIEALQNDLKRSELQRLEEVHCLENEINRLKKTLEINFIPVPM